MGFDPDVMGCWLVGFLICFSYEFIHICAKPSFSCVLQRCSIRIDRGELGIELNLMWNPDFVPS